MRHLLGFGLFAMVASVTACSTAEGGDDPRTTGEWACERADVPMGEVTRCTASSGAATTPTAPAAPVTGEPSTGLRTYGTPPAGSEDGASDAPAPSSEPPASTPYDCKASGDCPPSGDATPPPASDASPAGPDECTYTPDDLSYCGGDAPPKTNEPPVWNCEKDMNGNKVCETQPTCAPGTHATKCGCAPDGEADTCLPPAEGGCWVTGGGFIVEPSVVPAAPADGHDNYGGNAKQMKQGGVSGHWNHVDHGTKNHAKGKPSYLFCRHVDEPGPGQPGGKKGLTSNQVYFGGPAEWRISDAGAWESGYWFDVVAKDHGEPGSVPSPKNGGMVDTYHFTIRKMVDVEAKVSGPIVYEVKGGLVGGNIQIHPSNNGHPGIQSPLPTWVSLEP